MDEIIRSLHRQLFEQIKSELTEEDFHTFRSIAQGKGLRQGEASKCTTAREVLDKLQRKGKIKLGCYRVLKDIFMEMEQDGLIQVVTEIEGKMEEAGYTISDEIPQTQDVPRSPLKRQMSPPEGWSAEKRRNWADQGSGYSFDSSAKNPSMSRQSSAQSRRSSFASRSSMSGSSFEEPAVFEARDDRYKPGKGCVLIINNFSQEREASMKDVEGLTDFFKEVGYTISTEEDLTKEGMMDALEDAKSEIKRKSRSKNKEKYSSFICIVSSHGDKEGVKSHDNQTVSIGELQAPFLGDSLACMAGSPKIFIIQACRGEKKQPGVDRADEEPGEEGTMDMSDVMRSVTTPRDADVLVAYATTEGCQAYRRVGMGSWFLKDMLDVFQAKHRSDHLLDMLTEVNDRVSHRQTINSNPAKQMPCQVSTLTKKVYL